MVSGRSDSFFEMLQTRTRSSHRSGNSEVGLSYATGRLAAGSRKKALALTASAYLTLKRLC